MRLYAARDKNTGKLVSGITNPSHKFWQRQGDCESAIRRYNNDRYKRSNYDLELVTYELVEVKESTNSNYIRSMNDEELAKWLTSITDDAQLDSRTKCNYQWDEWLKEVRQ